MRNFMGDAQFVAVAECSCPGMSTEHIESDQDALRPSSIWISILLTSKSSLCLLSGRRPENKVAVTKQDPLPHLSRPYKHARRHHRASHAGVGFVLVF